MKSIITSKRVWFLVLGSVVIGTGCSRVRTSSVALSEKPIGLYPYGSTAFHRFVQDSYNAAGAGDPKAFHQWMAGVAPRPGMAVHEKYSLAWTEDLDSKRERRNQLPSSKAKADSERKEAIDLHRWEKKAIPRFSLDRGFEFTSVVALGERQCLLQSVLLASLLQRSGVNAGAVMVFRNGENEESNIGHVVTLVKLSNGRDVLTDASHKRAFVRHNGLYVWVTGAGYRFVEPVFVPGSPEIRSFRLAATGRPVSLAQVQGLDVAFLRSQFSYYRGERTPGGVLSSRPTAAGLRAQAKSLQESVARCPSNPLSTYMLGRAYLQTGRITDAGALFNRAHELYARAGWIPPGLQSAMAQARAVGAHKAVG